LTSTIAIHECDVASEPQWRDYIASRADATLYQTLRWRDLIVDVFGHEPVYLIAERGGAVVGVLPLFAVRLPLLGCKLISLPYDVGSGGALADDPATERALALAAIERARALSARYVELRCDAEHEALDGLGLRVARPVLISELSLAGGSAAVWGRVEKDHKKSLRKAQSRGVVIRAAESAADFERFYGVYLKTFLEFGTPPYGPRYFPALFEHLHAQREVRIFLAEVEGRALGGLVAFCFGRRWVSKFAACLPEAIPLRAYPALYGAALEAALEAGVERLSWGTSAPHQAGLIDFKQRWGAVTQPAVLYSAAVNGAAPDLARYYDENGLAQRAWRRLPLFATRLLGGPLNRWFC
jgi:Acetyltransferase (GNAT) domain